MATGHRAGARAHERPAPTSASLSGGRPITSHRHVELTVSSTVAWETLTHTERYRAWWPRLRVLDAAAGLVGGARWRCRVRSPLPYAVTFELSLDAVMPPEADDRGVVHALVDGDIVGRATLHLVPTSEGCELHLHSSLAPHRRLLRLLATAAPPIARWAHDRVLSSALAGLRHHAELPPLPQLPRTGHP